MIVAIPEGLPLAVSIAMALSITKLKNDEILIKNVESIQSAAMLHDLCVGKTGTMTKGKMSVKKYQLCNMKNLHDHDRDTEPDKFTNKLDINQGLTQLVKECIISNTDVRVETNDLEFKYEPKGQALEVGMIEFLVDNDEDIQANFIHRNLTARKFAQLPFDQSLKRMTVIREV